MSNPRKEFIGELKRAIAIADAAGQRDISFDLSMKCFGAWGIDPGFDRKIGEPSMKDDDELAIGYNQPNKPSYYIPKI